MPVKKEVPLKIFKDLANPPTRRLSEKTSFLEIAPNFEMALIAVIEENRIRSRATERVLRLKNDQRQLKTGCEHKSFAYGQRSGSLYPLY
jgi:hypothetical protein